LSQVSAPDMNLERIPGYTGHLVISQVDGAVLSSAGDLQSGERLAANLLNLVSTVGLAQLEANRISINYSDHSYILCCSNRKIHVVKKNLKSEVVA